MMFLSVIIPTRNRAKYLTGALESLTKQTYPLDMFEVLVVDNGSTDNTRESCASFNNRIPQLRYFYEETPGLHVGRHLGMKMAKSEILVYADDDIEAFPTWLEGISESFEDAQVVLVGGKNLPKYEVEPPVWIRDMWKKNCDDHRILVFLSILDLGNELKEISPLYVFGCNFSIRKSILVKAGGFHPDGMPDDLIRYRGDGETHVSKFIAKHKLKTLYNPKISVYHIIPMSRMNFQYLYKRAYAEGVSASYAAIRSSKGKGHVVRASLLLRQRTHQMIALMKQYKVQYYSNEDTGDADLSKIKVITQKAYWDGYFFHQRQVKTDKELIEWVTRESYL